MSLIEKMERRFSKEKRSLHFFDANCWLGRSNNMLATSLSSSTEILEQMDYYGIEKALISHTLSQHYHPFAGNEYLLKQIQRINRFQSCFVLLPPSTEETASLNAYINDALKKQVRAVRLFPKSHHFSLEEWSSKRLLEELEKHRIPLFIWARETEWDTLYRICKKYPYLPVVLEQPNEEAYWNGRFLFPLLDKCKNLFLEVHNCILYLGLDEIINRFGADRLVFGSYLPVDDPNASLMLITEGEFSKTDKEKIAHSNLERLIGGVLV